MVTSDFEPYSGDVITGLATRTGFSSFPPLILSGSDSKEACHLSLREPEVSSQDLQDSPNRVLLPSSPV